MSHYRSLLKVTFFTGFQGMKNSFGGSSKRPASKGAIIALLGVLAVIFGISLSVMGLGLGQMANSADARSQVFTFLLCVLSIILLLFSVAYLLNIMYFSRDNEFLLSLPIKNRTIYLVKITVVYLYLMIFSVFILGFVGIPFGISTAMPWTYYIGLLISMAFAPVFPLFIGTLLSFPLMYVVSYIKRNRILTTLSVLLAVAAFAGFYILIFSGGMNAGEEGSGDIILSPGMLQLMTTLGNVLLFYRAITNLFVSHADILLSIVYFIGFNALFGAISIFLSSSLYRRGMSKQLEASAEIIKVAKGSEYKSSSVVKSLVKKELKIFLRTPTVLFYAFFEVIFPTVMCLIFVFALSGGTGGGMTGGIEQILSVGMVTLFGLMFACGMNFLAISAVSVEGRAYFLMKISPIPILKQLNIKGHIAYCLPVFSLLCSAITAAAIGVMPVYSAALYFVFTSVIAYGFTFLQMGMDVRNPRLDWENIAQIMQNRTSVLISMLLSFIPVVIMIGAMVATFFLGMSVLSPLVAELLMWSVLIVAAAATSFFIKRSFVKNVERQFDRIEF